MRLVVLDDDEAIAQFMAAVASGRGWDARAVMHEAEFQALIRAAPPSAIILDLQLATSDGIEQLRFLHSVGYRGAIVLISGFDARVLASAQQIGHSLGLSIVAAIEKPARAAQVRDVLATIEQSPTVRPHYLPPTHRRLPDRFRRTMSRRRSTPVGWNCICNRSCPPSDMR